MGLLDDAIKEHLELKRRHGADAGEVARLEHEAHYVQQTGAGLQAVDVELGASGVARASMLQEPVVFGDEIDPARVLGALGLDLADGHPELPPQVVSTGLAHLMIPAREDDVLEETPEFLQETPEHDRLWFEQKPPRDFDF